MSPEADDFPALVLAYRLSACLLAAMELGLADAIANGTDSIDELADALGCDRSTLARLVRALVAAEVLESRDGRLMLTPFADRMRADREDSQADMILGWHGLSEAYAGWGAMAQTVRSGAAPFARLFGALFHEYLADHPERGRLYSKANESTTDVFDAVAAAYPFNAFGTVVDVGSGRGAFLKAICAAHRGVRGVLFDLAPVVAGVDAELAAEGFADRITVRAGSAVDDVPVGDAYVFSTVLRCFDDEVCLRMLRNVRGTAPDATVLVLDLVMDEHPDLRLALADLQNLVTYGGRDRTRAEWVALLSEAGYTLSRTITVEGDSLPLLEATPA